MKEIEEITTPQVHDLPASVRQSITRLQIKMAVLQGELQAIKREFDAQLIAALTEQGIDVQKTKVNLDADAGTYTIQDEVKSDNGKIREFHSDRQ